MDQMTQFRPSPHTYIRTVRSSLEHDPITRSPGAALRKFGRSPFPRKTPVAYRGELMFLFLVFLGIFNGFLLYFL